MSGKKRIVVYDLDKSVREEKSEKVKTDLTELTSLADAGQHLGKILQILSIGALVLVLLTMLFLILPDVNSRILTFTTLGGLTAYVAWRVRRGPV